MSAAVTRTCEDDGTLHFSTIKRIADSGKQYLDALSSRGKSSPAQMLGSAVHALVLGQRPDAPVVVYPGRRAGKEWEAFDAAHAGATILNAAEWDKANTIAASVLADTVAREYLDGARFEVPLSWDDGDVKCSTSGVDIVQPGRIGDLKTARTTAIAPFQRQAFGFGYHCQLAWYRRGARANGLDVSRGVFVVAVETCSPYEVVVHDLDADLLDHADREIALWLERYRSYRDANQWPGRVQSSVLWTLPTYLQADDEDADDDD